MAPGNNFCFVYFLHIFHIFRIFRIYFWLPLGGGGWIVIRTYNEVTNTPPGDIYILCTNTFFTYVRIFHLQYRLCLCFDFDFDFFFVLWFCFFIFSCCPFSHSFSCFIGVVCAFNRREKVIAPGYIYISVVVDVFCFVSYFCFAPCFYLFCSFSRRGGRVVWKWYFPIVVYLTTLLKFACWHLLSHVGFLLYFCSCFCSAAGSVTVSLPQKKTSSSSDSYK